MDLSTGRECGSGSHSLARMWRTCGITERPFHSVEREDQAAPYPVKTTKIVRNINLKSSQSEKLSMYLESISTHFSKQILFRPLTCHIQVSPGFMLKRRLCHVSYISTSAGSGGLGPTRLMFPRNTLNSWGISSMLSLRMNRPNEVTRGSCFILKTGPFISF